MILHDCDRQRARGAQPAPRLSGSPHFPVSRLVLCETYSRIVGHKKACHTQPISHPPSSTIFRAGRLLTLSMPVSSSAFPASPPQPSWRMRWRMSRYVRSRNFAWHSLTIWTLPQRSHSMWRNHDGWHGPPVPVPTIRPITGLRLPPNAGLPLRRPHLAPRARRAPLGRSEWLATPCRISPSWRSG